MAEAKFNNKKNSEPMNGLEGLTYCELARVAQEAISEVRRRNAKSEELSLKSPNGSDRGPKGELTRSWSSIQSLDFLVLLHHGKRTRNI